LIASIITISTGAALATMTQAQAAIMNQNTLLIVAMIGAMTGAAFCHTWQRSNK